MSVSTCIKCRGHSFAVVLFTPVGGSQKLSIVQCSGCGTPIGMMDLATGPQIEALKAQVAAIDERLSRIARARQDSGAAPLARADSNVDVHLTSKNGHHQIIRPCPFSANNRSRTPCCHG